MNDVRDAVQSYRHVIVFTVSNMRNNKFKDLRQALPETRVFMGKNRVMSLALGESEESEVRDGYVHYYTIVTLYQSSWIPVYAILGRSSMMERKLICCSIFANANSTVQFWIDLCIIERNEYDTRD